MITHNSFLKKWLGKRYRETVKLGFQCCSIVKKYCEEVYGIKGLSCGGSAIDAWNRQGNFDNYFDRVDYPQQGDIVFFDKTSNNKWGHIAVHNDDFSILEQNGGIGGGTGLGVDAIRLHKAPSNALGFMRPKPIDVKPLVQFGNPDCSLASVVNCYRLNGGNDARSLTQEVLNAWMQEYIQKTPHDAFLFIKSKKYNIKYSAMTFKGSKVRLNKGSAVVFYMRGKTNALSHYTCVKKIDGKYHVFDSTTPVVNILDEIDTAYANGVFNDVCCSIK